MLEVNLAAKERLEKMSGKKEGTLIKRLGLAESIGPSIKECQLMQQDSYSLRKELWLEKLALREHKLKNKLEYNWELIIADSHR